MKRIFILFPAALSAVLSCTKVQETTVRIADDAAQHVIGFEAFTHKNTKAFMETLQTAQNAKRIYYLTAYNSPVVGKDSAFIDRERFGYGINPEFPNAWNTATTHYWPQTAIGSSSTTSLNFFVYGPDSTNMVYGRSSYVPGQTENYPTLTVSVRDKVLEQVDMLAAMSEYETYQASGVSIAFNHILSAVTFTATAEADTIGYLISEIRVGVAADDTTTAALYPSGVYTYARLNEKGEWSSWAGTKKQYRLGLAAADTVKKGGYTGLTANNGILMLIPQELEQAGAHFAVTYDVYDRTRRTKTATGITKFGTLYATSLKEWSPGVKYNYSLTIPAEDYKPITYNVTVNDWTEQDVVISESDDLSAEDEPESMDTDGGNFGRNEW